jgi:hypothetical protein
VSAVLDESEPNSPSIEFLNEGLGVAVEVEYVAETPSGELTVHSVGDITPMATASVQLRGDVDPRDPVRIAWRCRDFKGRVRVWSYDGRSKRLRGAKAATAEAAFRAMYP